jgi:hypothetical protein
MPACSSSSLKKLLSRTKWVRVSYYSSSCSLSLHPLFEKKIMFTALLIYSSQPWLSQLISFLRLSARQLKSRKARMSSQLSLLQLS